MSPGTAIAIGLELCSTTLVNVAYVREHEAAAALPALSLRRPLQSLRLLLTDRSWLAGFALETGGFALYAGALALASLALVQSIGAGGMGLLAYASARLTGRRVTRLELAGSLIAVIGLVALALSLTGSGTGGGHGSLPLILVWLGATALAALLVGLYGKRLVGAAAAYGIAGGLLFSIGDICTKLTTQGGTRFAFAIGLVGGYTLGTSLLQLGYQRGGALTVAGVATLLTNALPIAAGTVVLNEPVPSGALGLLRVFAFAAVTVGAILLARPKGGADATERGASA